MYALFVLRVKDLRRSTKHLHIPHRIAFLQLQAFFAQKEIPQKQHKVARRGMLRAGGHDPHRPISNTCFAYRRGQTCPSATECKAHDIINALIYAQDSHVFVWGTHKQYPNDIFGATDARVWETLIATYKNDHDRIRQILREMVSNGFVDHGVRFFHRCMLIATRTNNPAMILTFKKEVEGQSVNNEYHRSRLGEPSPLHNCLNESIRLGYLEVFDNLLQWNWKFANPDWSLHRYLERILTAKHFSQSQREDFFSILLERTEAWRGLCEMSALLVLIGESDNQRALEILLKVSKTKNVNPQLMTRYHAPSEPLSALTKNGNFELVKLYLENRNFLLPNIYPDADGLMRRLVVDQELKSESPRIPLIKLIIDHSGDLLEEKLQLMTVLTQPEIQKQDLVNWAWLALKLDLKSVYNSAPPGSFGSILLRDAVSALKVETVEFLVSNGVSLESDASTPQVYEDDEETMQRLKSVQMLLARGGQGQFSERKTVETTFSCVVDRAPKTNKRMAISKRGPKRVGGLAIARGVRNVIGTADLESYDQPEDFEAICDSKEAVSKAERRPKTNGRSYAAVAAANTMGGLSSQKLPSVSSGSTTTLMSPSHYSASN